MKRQELKANLIISGPIFPEPVQVMMTHDMGNLVKVIGKGLRTEKFYDPILDANQLDTITASPEHEPFDGDPIRFRLGIEGMRLGLAYEYDPYFSLSIARVDPLPHQLEAVYDYFLKLPRIRFLLADDPGAGKTIMAGLLIKELKIRGLAKRTLIVTPANLSFQWQRELKDKFRENFEVIRSDVLRANYGSNPWQEKNQVITSVSWVSRIEDAKDSLLRSHWDLIIVDEAHKMSANSADKKTLAYQLGESLSAMTDHYLLMTQIHGGMKIGDRDTPGTRIYAEREFRESSQVLVATEAAGEGINLQFCWLMVNYDIPWNPVRLEQRMGRIHRYGQEKDCLIFNFVTTNTREGRVLHKLFERVEQIESDLDPNKTGKVFNVLGDVFPGNQLEKMLRDMYAKNNMTEELIKQRIIEQVDTERFKDITNSTLEGLAKRELNLSAILGKSAEARERRLVPEVIQDFFLQAAPIAGITMTEPQRGRDVFRIGRVPRHLWPIGEQLEPRFGRLGREYKQVVFDKEKLKKEATAEWVTPGHPLFEVVREDVQENVRDDLARGAVFFDLNRDKPARISVFSAAVRDGRGNELHKRLFIVQQHADGSMELRQPTYLLDLMAAPAKTTVPDNVTLDDAVAERFLVSEALQPFLADIVKDRTKEIETISRHMEISLNELINRQQLRMADLYEQQGHGDSNSLIAANIKQVDDRLEELNGRLERRRTELSQERHCTISDIRRVGVAWVLPHPERKSPMVAPFVRDEEIERIAIEAVIAHERARGWEVTSVEADNRGFDLISRRPHPEDPHTAIEVRFIEVKGRVAVGEVALTTNEYRTAQRLRKDYWLYVVFNCGSTPDVKLVQDPSTLDWEPLVKIEHYHVNPKAILDAASQEIRTE